MFERDFNIHVLLPGIIVILGPVQTSHYVASYSMNVNSKLFTAAVGDFYYGINSIRCSVIVKNRCLQF